jgi:hypothetical protein
MYLRFICVVIATSLTSCVGYDVLSGGKSTCEYYGNVYQKCDRGDLKDKNEVLNALGNPLKIVYENDTELYIYRKHCQFCDNQLSFRGIVLGLIVPIPLILPIGYNNATFEFDKTNRLKTITRETTENSAFLCGIIPAGHLGFGCYVDERRKDH